MKRGNFICHTTFCDNNQNKDWWYNVDSSNEFMIKDTHFKLYAYYESFKMINGDNKGDKEKLMLVVKEISRIMLKLAEEVISLYNEYINRLILEANLVEQIEPVLSKIEEFFMASTGLDIASIDLQIWMLNIFVIIHSFTFYYNGKYLAQRTPENRKACMEMTIKNYYTDLEEIVEFES